jgi:hypothetical protein
MKPIYVYFYAVKYWAQGDEWDEAVSYAKRIVYGFR